MYLLLLLLLLLSLMTMMMLLFLLWFYPRNSPLKFSQNWVSNRKNVAFVCCCCYCCPCFWSQKKFGKTIWGPKKILGPNWTQFHFIHFFLLTIFLGPQRLLVPETCFYSLVKIGSVIAEMLLLLLLLFLLPSWASTWTSTLARIDIDPIT